MSLNINGAAAASRFKDYFPKHRNVKVGGIN